jgi:hypothetical protein
MAIEVKYNRLGFMNDASFTFHFQSIINGYDDQFGGAEKVKVEISEMTLADLRFDREKWLQISEDGNEVTIKFTAQKYYDFNGKVTSIPSANDVLSDLHNLMKRAIKLYGEEFPPQVDEQIEE